MTRGGRFTCSLEVGTLGFVAHSTRRACQRLGAWSHVFQTEMEEVALRASYAIYTERKAPGWSIGGWRVRMPGVAAVAEVSGEVRLERVEATGTFLLSSEKGVAAL